MTLTASPPSLVSLYFVAHVEAGLAHGLDGGVERDQVAAVAVEGEARR